MKPRIISIIFLLSISSLFVSCSKPANEAVPECEEIVVKFLDAVKTDRMETARTYCFNSYIEDHLNSREEIEEDLSYVDFHTGTYSYLDADPDGWTSRRKEVNKVEVSQEFCVFEIQKDNHDEWKIFSHKINYVACD